jgi:DNA-binding transcriptional ArsR family regulator
MLNSFARYQITRDHIGTGDLVLFSGKGDVSEWIKKITGGPWSHIGRCLVSKESDLVLLWESTTLSNLMDLDTGVRTKGAQVVELSERIRTYDGAIAIRHIRPRITAEMEARLWDLRREFKGRLYEKSLIELFKSAYDGPLGKNKSDLTTLFCSELIAEGDMRMGMMPPPVQPSNEFTPMDFAENHMVDGMHEAAGSLYCYGPEIMIKTAE